jgi:hypothetical protein
MPAVNVNNGGFDPLQGFHTTVFVNDQASGKPILLGGFTGFQWTIMNATERYLPFGSKNSRLLDGINAYGWTLERGMIDDRIMQEVFGRQQVGSEFKAAPNPRLVITIQFNAPELDNAPVNYGDTEVGIDNNSTLLGGTGRSATGSYQLRFAKVDNLTIAGASGGNIIANRLEGMCEDIIYNPNPAITTSSDATRSKVDFTKVQLGIGKVGDRNYLFG